MTIDNPDGIRGRGFKHLPAPGLYPVDVAAECGVSHEAVRRLLTSGLLAPANCAEWSSR
jgi:hypothetical protein